MPGRTKLLRTALASALALAAFEALRSPTPAAAQDAIRLAVTPLPESERAEATVLELRDGEAVTLRGGAGDFICLADIPGDDRFQAACYHESLEPYMARGRALRAEGVAGAVNVARRAAEIEAGTLAMPAYALLHQVFGPAGWSGDMAEARRLTVIYVPFATAEAVGLPTRPAGMEPWLMAPGQANAHIMIPG